MADRKSNSTIADEHLAARAFVDRRHDPERYRQEAGRLCREAGMTVNASIADRLLAVALRFDELASTVEKMQARNP